MRVSGTGRADTYNGSEWASENGIPLGSGSFGDMTFLRLGTKKLTTRVTAAGRKLLKGKKKLKLEAVATFTSHGKEAIRATKEITLVEPRR